jgi:hypothetical protein
MTDADVTPYWLPKHLRDYAADRWIDLRAYERGGIVTIVAKFVTPIEIHTNTCRAKADDLRDAKFDLLGALVRGAVDELVEATKDHLPETLATTDASDVAVKEGASR